jgi:two-component system, OmpR family, alkaline phosphatase synthesis response regulator PhoP
MIYYVEDDADIRELVLYTLRQSGFEARGFQDGEGFALACEQEMPELVLLDIMLPGRGGNELLRDLKSSRKTAAIPVILLTAKGAEYDKVAGLNGGADDYIVKPFGMMELVSRVKAVLRRSVPPKTGLLDSGGVRLDTDRHTAWADGAEVELTLKEYELLRFLMENEGIAFSREKLLDAVWGYGYFGFTRTVDVHIQTLRQKLGSAGAGIRTVRGVGYRFGRA